MDPRGVVEAAIDAVRPAADAKEIRLQTILDPLAGPITGDPERLQQVVWNLLANAVRFTPRRGRIQVTLRRVSSHVDIVVSDTGEGIDPATLPFIFERFRQGAGRQHGGLGIGLALVGHLVELHGGEVKASSDGPGTGATFTVRLPVTIARLEPEAALPPAVASTFRTDVPALRGLRVLAVDDDRDSLELLRSVLDVQGATVTTAGSSKEALERLHEGSFDVLLSDIEMPGGDGIELLRQVRARGAERGLRLPAVAITAYGRVEDRIRILSAGFNSHLAKPVDPSELIAVILSVTGRGLDT